MRFAVVDGTPVPKTLEYPCQQVTKATGLTLVSGYRGDNPAGARLVRQLGKSTQRDLWNGFIMGRPGFNPANRPGQSTHECRNDGVAYRGPVGMPLLGYQCGMDWTWGAGAVREFNRLGYSAALTYPGNPREGQHVNLRRKPRTPLFVRLPLRKGNKSRRVKYLKHQLHFIHDPDNREPYYKRHEGKPKGGWGKWFSEDLETAVRRFQRDHDQRADGVVGFQTKHQLDVAYRHAKQREKQGKR